MPHFSLQITASSAHVIAGIHTYLMANLFVVSDAAVDRASESLNDLSQAIWKQPELCYQEFFAHKLLTDFLNAHGFKVECGYKGLKTAFRATYGDRSARPNVVIFCEYDALPDIGHACGHNLIAEVGVAAGLGVKAALEAAENTIGQVTILGSPAEEGGGGKIKLLDAGALEGVDAAMMSHPAGFELPKAKSLAVKEMTVRYKGRASHASAFPWEGVNALDAAVLCYQNLSCLRQQLKPHWQMHGVISNGGSKPNIIPEQTELDYLIRAPSAKDLLSLRRKFVACVDAAAQATGCTVEITDVKNPYLNVIQNEALVRNYEKHSKAVGAPDAEEDILGGSTDMGNVSYRVPSIHPCFSIQAGAINHTREFTKASGDHVAQGRTLLEAKVLARVALDVMLDKELLSEAQRVFESDITLHGGDAVNELLSCGEPD